MNVHVAIYKWRDGVDAARVDSALRQVQQLQHLVPGVTHIFVGPNTSPHAKHYTHAIVVIGRSATAIDAYRKHPLHVQVANDIDAMEADGIGIDFHDMDNS